MNIFAGRETGDLQNGLGGGGPIRQFSPKQITVTACSRMFLGGIG